MQILNRIRSLPGLAVLGIFLLGGIPLFAVAHDGHMAHGGGKAARAELGTSAAFDTLGRLCIVSMETAREGQYVVLQMSADMGRKWSAPERIQRQAEPVSAEGENRPKIAFGKEGELYVTYTKPLAKPSW